MAFPAIFNLTSLNGKNGFAINGINTGDDSGMSVSGAGDINGDGIADIIIGAWYASPNGNYQAGQSYVIYGNKTGFAPSLYLESLNGLNGFVINGMNTDDNSGRSVGSAGDVNDDGIDDIIIGAPNASPYENHWSGQSYVIFGDKAGFGSSFNLSALNGINGFAINGINAYDQSGVSVSSAGDVNADGIADIIICAFGASPNGNQDAGQSYVIFGDKTGSAPSFNLSALNGINGFAINGINTGDDSGYSVSSAGDVNDDGIADIIIGAWQASPNGNQDAGQSYVIFGDKTGSAPSFNLSGLNGINGFAINGINADDQSGRSVGSAGDVNDDGIADVIIGASGTSPNGIQYAGQSYVIFGQKSSSFDSELSGKLSTDVMEEIA